MASPQRTDFTSAFQCYGEVLLRDRPGEFWSCAPLLQKLRLPQLLADAGARMLCHVHRDSASAYCDGPSSCPPPYDELPDDPFAPVRNARGVAAFDVGSLPPPRPDDGRASSFTARHRENEALVTPAHSSPAGVRSHSPECPPQANLFLRTSPPSPRPELPLTEPSQILSVFRRKNYTLPLAPYSHRHSRARAVRQTPETNSYLGGLVNLFRVEENYKLYIRQLLLHLGNGCSQGFRGVRAVPARISGEASSRCLH